MTSNPPMIGAIRYRSGKAIAQNPWGLAPCEARAMDAMIECGDFKTAAKRLGIDPITVKTQLRYAGEKMKEPGRLAKYLKWDRWRRNE